MRIVPTISDSSEVLGGDPVTPQFFRAMRDLESGYFPEYSASDSSQDLPSQRSITESEYEREIECKNRLTKCGMCSCFLAIIGVLSMA